MLLHQQFVCKHCGRNYELLSSFKTDKEKESLIGQSIKCLSCGSKMRIVNNILDKNLYNIRSHDKSGISICLLDFHNAFISCNEDSIVIDVRHLLAHGFHGNISVINGINNTLVSASLHPVEHEISFYEISGLKKSSD